jgi:hypothetical protein
MIPEEKAAPKPPPVLFLYDRVMYTEAHWNVLWEYGHLGLRQLRISTRGTVVDVKSKHVVTVAWDKGDGLTDHFADNLEVVKS